MTRIRKYFSILLIFVLLFIGYFFIGQTSEAEEIFWAMNFSQKYAEHLGLDWKETYSAFFSDLGVKNIKIAAHWDLLEPEKDNYYLDDLDWQIKEAEKYEAEVLLVIGMKTPRWPECHIPSWANNLSKEEREKEVLEIIEKLVLKYKDSSSIMAWQVENEPFLLFGNCPKFDKKFLEKEVALVKSLDDKPVVISGSGEWSFWTRPAQLGDIIGTTMYRKVWFTPYFLNESPILEGKGFYVSWPFRPIFYYKKAEIAKNLFNKDVICVELQAEPFGPKSVLDISLEEQKKTMDLKKFQENIIFAKETGLDTFYFWGGEWWYWMKTKHNQPEIWDEAKKLFHQ